MYEDVAPELLVEAHGAVRLVTLNRPDDMNAVNHALQSALARVWRLLIADRDARAVVLTGAGRAFSAGGDLDWMTEMLEDHAERDESLRQQAEIIDELVRFPLPVVAAINGPAIGLGCSVAILCDVVLIAEDAYLCDPHVSVGLVAGDGGAAFWPLLTPLLRSREYLLTGARIPAATAVELGLATRVVPAGEVREAAFAVAERIAKQPPAAVQGTKRVLNMHLARALAGPVQAGFAAEQASMATDDHRRRLLALRDPQR